MISVKIPVWWHAIPRPLLYRYGRFGRRLLTLSSGQFIEILHTTVLRRVRKIAKSDYVLRFVCLSFCPRGTTRLPPDGFSWNLIF